jgi:endoglucanase
MRARAAVLALALVAALVGLSIPAAATASTPTAPTPVVVGNRIVDSRTNTTWIPHGANWPSFEYACSEGWGYSQDDDTNAAAAAMVSWGINAIRVPLNQNCWLGSDSSDYGTAAGYQAAVAAWVGILNAHGIVVILDLHWSAPTGQRASGQWPMADANSVTFWKSVATAYASNPSVVFDAFNEPYSTGAFTLTWDCWENGGCKAPLVTTDQVPVSCYNATTGACTYTVAGMSQLVTAIRAGGAKQPIMLGGLNYSNDLSGWLAHEPTDSDSTPQLIASWHNYPGQDSCGYTVACWNAATSTVAASVPIITGEFGETDGGSNDLTAYMNWADAHGIGYLPWAWWDASGLTDPSDHDALLYALYSGPNFTPQAPAGTAYKAHLAALPVPPSSRVLHTLPLIVAAPSVGTGSAPLSTTDSRVDVSAITPPQLQQLALSSQRNLRISASG